MSQMLVGELVAGFLTTLISLGQVKRVLEIGTYTGYSALAMAEALPENGEIVTLDINAENVEIGKSFWQKSPHGQKIKSIIGDAHESIASLSGSFDMIFIDADKTGYIKYLRAGLEKLSKRGFIVVDNCLWSGDVLKESSSDQSTQALRSFNEYVAGRADLQKTLVPIRDGLFLIKPNN